jgi:DNA invertase Pin-like site-specific DNA recombinase
MKYTIMKYLRISAEDIDLDGFDKFESNSIANQRDLLNDFIAKIPDFADCEIVEELDDGRTGTNFLRPGVQRVIEMAQSGKINVIIVKDLSRWGRNYLEVGDFLEQKFPEWGVRFISINDNYDSANFVGATGGIDIAFRNLIYEMYSQDLSEKVRSAKLSAAKSGKNCNAEAFYGYIKDPTDTRKLAVDEPAAEIVRRIFDLAAQDYTSERIARTLNDEKIPTPQERKMQLGSKRRWRKTASTFWYSSVICLIIKDERYTGKLIYGRKRTDGVGSGKQVPVPENEWTVVPGAIPAIITEELFQTAQFNAAKRSKSVKSQSDTVYLLSGKIKCGRCGMAMKSVRSSTAHYYYCYTGRLTDRYGCTEFKIYESDIASAVLAALQQQMAFADKARELLDIKTEQLTPNIEKLKAEIDRLQRQIEKTKTTKMSLWEKYHNGNITAEAFQQENEKADDQAQQYAGKIPVLQEEIRKLESETGRENIFVERFSKQSGITELTRSIVEEFVKEIKVFAADRIEIVFNYADEYEKIAETLKQPKSKLRATK